MILLPEVEAILGCFERHKDRKIGERSDGRALSRIYIDWLRNSRGATCIAPWGLRARPGATVSMPVSMPVAWSQLAGAVPAGYTIYSPAEIPAEWMELKPQSISKALLREFGIA